MMNNAAKSLTDLLRSTLRRHVAGTGVGSRLAARVLDERGGEPRRDFDANLPGRRAFDRVLEQFARTRLGLEIDHATLRSWRDAGRDVVPGSLEMHPPPAAVGQAIVLATWAERTLGESSNSNSLLRRLARTQTASGAFFHAHPEDSPDALWFDELAVLHVMTSVALERNDDQLRIAAVRSATFHFVETQPDHATTLPLGIHAFALDEAHVGFAHGMLHAMSMHNPGGPSEPALLLLADALHCLGVTHAGVNR
jgi:hypothetical protein